MISRFEPGEEGEGSQSRTSESRFLHRLFPRLECYTARWCVPMREVRTSGLKAAGAGVPPRLRSTNERRTESILAIRRCRSARYHNGCRTLVRPVPSDPPDPAADRSRFPRGDARVLVGLCLGGVRRAQAIKNSHRRMLDTRRILCVHPCSDLSGQTPMTAAPN